MVKYLFISALFIANMFAVNTVQAQQDATSVDSLTGVVVYRQNINMTSSAIALDTLRFNRRKSIFEWNLYPSSTKKVQKAKKKYFNVKVVGKQKEGANSKGQVTLFNTANDSIFSRMNMTFINKQLYLKEKAPAIEWAIKDSTKMIGSYMTRKATARFRGRYYTAWFTPEIPLPYGPWKLHGLPGLILQAYDRSGRIYFSAVDIALTEVGSIGPITLTGNEQMVTLAEYINLLDNFKQLMKSAVMKKVRPYVGQQDIANMSFQLPNVKHMEKFNSDNDQ